MPTVNGFSGNEVVARVVKYAGDTSTDFQSYLEDSLNLAQFRFCKAHDWAFLQRSDILAPQVGVGGPNNFDLSVIVDPISGNNIMIYTSDINIIRMVYPGTILRKSSLQDLRRFDPAELDGTIADSPAMWCPVSDTRFKLWPDNFGGGAVVTFQGTLAYQAQSLLTVTSTLTPTVTPQVLSNQTGGSGKNDIQIIKFDQAPVSGTFTITFGVNTTAPLAYNASSAVIQAALEALPNIGAGNITVDNRPIAGLCVIDAKVVPSFWSDYSLPPIIPFKYQESFIRYMTAIGLDYLDDSRADAKKAEALDDIKADIIDDMNRNGDVDLPRIRAMFEARLDGAGANLNSLLFGFLASYD